MKYNMIFLVYVNNTIIYGINKEAIEVKIQILGVSSEEHRPKFGLRDEGKVAVFIGNRIEKIIQSRLYFT